MEPNQIIEVVKEHYSNQELTVSLEERRFVTFNKETENRILYCGGIDTYTRYTGGITCRVIFKDYEKLFLGTGNLNELRNCSSIRASSFARIISWDFNKRYQVGFPMKFNHEDDIIEYFNKFNEYFINIANPFFKYWQDIRTFLPFIQTSDVSEFTRILGNNSIIKKMIIWKLCDHPGFKDFAKKRIEILEKAVRDQPENDKYKKVLGEIKEKYTILNNTPTKYKWDPSYLEKKDFSAYMDKTDN